MIQKKQKALQTIVNYRNNSKKRFQQSPSMKKLDKSSNHSNFSLRIKTQQSISPKAIQKTSESQMDELQNKSKIQIIFSHEEKLHNFLFAYEATTDHLLLQARKIVPTISAVVTTNSNLAIDYYLQLPNQRLSVFQGRIITVQGVPGLLALKSKTGLRDFIFIKCIGVGGFSRVYLVKKKQSSRFYAMKIIDKKIIIEKKIENIIENERNILAVTQHPFLNKLEYALECPNHLIFITEFCAGGDLLYYLQKYHVFTESQARFYIVEFILGLIYLHQLDIIYRDIKPENILIDITGHIQIADFGLAKPTRNEYAYSFCGSPEYMAPEMLTNQGHNQQLDHYCLGVLLYELVVGQPPFYSEDINKIYENIILKEVEFPKNNSLSNEIKDLIVRLLDKDQKSRIGHQGGLLEILDHKWFESVDLIKFLYRKVNPPFQPDVFKPPALSKEYKDGDLDLIRRLLDRNVQGTTMFQNFYYDQSVELDIRLEQQKFLKFYHQLIEQQNSKMQRKQKIKFMRKSRLV
ncbi:unnamed protein product [Paramecium octaurelia]|uniref:Protein kinase domain-containing protein n=1 Tax=Paramecium octaurelia TaxID=43137 RepID=A0A8S1VSL8_PAROT|nr:unnamed protein product [Paramecium octaurelia]